MKTRKKKKGKSPVQAGGGIVLRHGARPLVAIVQRRKDNRWVLPKGKLKAGEGAKAGARREAVEETGQSLIVHDFIGAISYEARGRPKVAHFWRMQTRDGAPRELMRDIKAVEWLSLKDAVAQLSYPLERSFLVAVGRQVLQAARHAAPRRKAARRAAVKRKATRKRRSAKADAGLLGRLFR